MTFIALLGFLLAFVLLAVASVVWGVDSRDLRDHSWEPRGS